MQDPTWAGAEEGATLIHLGAKLQEFVRLADRHGASRFANIARLYADGDAPLQEVVRGDVVDWQSLQQLEHAAFETATEGFSPSSQSSDEVIAHFDRAREELVNKLVKAGMGSDALRYGFLVFPPLGFVAEEANAAFVPAVHRFNKDWQKQLLAGGELDPGRVERALHEFVDLAARYGALRFRDLIIFYAGILGPISVLHLGETGPDWNRIRECERTAFSGEYRTEPWWPEDHEGHSEPTRTESPNRYTSDPIRGFRWSAPDERAG